MNAPAVQFDPDSARFGTSRSQKRIEDDRLLSGRGLYSDDRVTAGQAWLVMVRSQSVARDGLRSKAALAKRS